MSTNTTIRPYEGRDCGALVRLVHARQDDERGPVPGRFVAEGVASAYCEHIEERTRQGAGRIFVAECDGDVVGFVCCRAEESKEVAPMRAGRRYGYISEVYVAAPRRGQGIGRALLAAAERHLAELGLHRALVYALPDNEAAQRVYRRAGFKPHELLLEKPLTRPGEGPARAAHGDPKRRRRRIG